MIDRDVASTLAEQLRQIEARLERLLASGWRQARGEAASLHTDAEILAGAGLVEVAARVTAVAEAQDAAGALQSIALATSACRLLRLRLATDQEVPAGWLPLAAPQRKSRPNPDRLLPVARVRLADRELWACVWLARSQLPFLLLEPPFPEAAEEDVAPSAVDPGIFGRLRQQIGQAFGGEARQPSFWLHRRLLGTLRWQARYPLASESDVALCTLDDAAWEVGNDDPDLRLQAFHQGVSADKLVDGHRLISSGGLLRVKKLQRDDAASYVWLDQTAAAVFAQAPDDPVWAIVWAERDVLVPVARIVPGGVGHPARLIHLVSGAPEAILA